MPNTDIDKLKKLMKDDAERFHSTLERILPEIETYMNLLSSGVNSILKQPLLTGLLALSVSQMNAKSLQSAENGSNDNSIETGYDMNADTNGRIAMIPDGISPEEYQKAVDAARKKYGPLGKGAPQLTTEEIDKASDAAKPALSTCANPSNELELGYNGYDPYLEEWLAKNNMGGQTENSSVANTQRKADKAVEKSKDASFVDAWIAQNFGKGGRTK